MRSGLRVRDAVAVAVGGLAARRGRSALTALGIAIGIAAIVAVLGITASGRADLLATLDELGTNLLRLTPGQGVFSAADELPDTAPAMVARVGPVRQVTATTRIDAAVRRNDLISELETGGISVLAADPGLAPVLGAEMAAGRFHDPATAAVPAVVLGDVAAARLGITSLEPRPRVVVGDEWFTVIGVMAPLTLHPDLDRSALIGYEVAASVFDAKRAPTAVYARVAPDRVEDAVGVLPATANPENPDQVEVTRPSDALEARQAADEALTLLLVGLGAVALLVGGVAIANIMVMSVLERRREIGVRRALGATRGHVRTQFLLESMLLAGAGGVLGAGLGAAITVGFAANQDFTVAVPLPGLAASIAAALAIGALSGLYPAIRAARIPPAEAVRAP